MEDRNMGTEYLYHYTNIESLALILKNQTIRFNSLDRMDDLQEKESADIKNIGQFCFITSWTSESLESIPMWNMYASLTQGVRIKLRKDPFKIYDNDISELAMSSNVQIGNGSSTSIKSIMPIKDLFEKGFFSVQALNLDSLLCEVQYTTDNEKLYPHLLQDNGEQFSIALQKLGRYKNVHWEFQKEWRYILNFIPLDLKKISLVQFTQIANDIRIGQAKQPFSYYDMVIDDGAFSDMEITLSPRISAGSRAIVETLVQRFNPAAKMTDSTLKDLI